MSGRKKKAGRLKGFSSGRIRNEKRASLWLRLFAFISHQFAGLHGNQFVKLQVIQTARNLPCFIARITRFCAFEVHAGGMFPRRGASRAIMKKSVIAARMTLAPAGDRVMFRLSLPSYVSWGSMKNSSQIFVANFHDWFCCWFYVSTLEVCVGRWYLHPFTCLWVRINSSMQVTR